MGCSRRPRIFTSWEFCSGYWAVSIHERARRGTRLRAARAIATHERHEGACDSGEARVILAVRAGRAGAERRRVCESRWRSCRRSSRQPSPAVRSCFPFAASLSSVYGAPQPSRSSATRASYGGRYAVYVGLGSSRWRGRTLQAVLGKTKFAFISFAISLGLFTRLAAAPARFNSFVRPAVDEWFRPLPRLLRRINIDFNFADEPGAVV